jgi:hypothetical protein
LQSAGITVVTEGTVLLERCLAQPGFRIAHLRSATISVVVTCGCLPPKALPLKAQSIARARIQVVAEAAVRALGFTAIAAELIALRLKAAVLRHALGTDPTLAHAAQAKIGRQAENAIFTGAAVRAQHHRTLACVLVAAGLETGFVGVRAARSLACTIASAVTAVIDGAKQPVVTACAHVGRRAGTGTNCRIANHFLAE